MFGIAAAVAFGLALLLELIDESLGVVTVRALALAGLLLLALHLAAPFRRGRSRR
jgi:hypothetical protein